MHSHSELIQFYKNCIGELGLKNIGLNNLQYLYNLNLKSINYTQITYNKITYNNKEMILADDDYWCIPDKDKLSKIIFHPLDKNGGLCSLLAIDDSVHMKLSISIYLIFKKVLEIKFGLDTDLYNHFDNKYIEKLPDGDKITIRKWYNLYNIISGTSSKILISFTIDLTNQSQSAKVNFTYPLYNYLDAIHNNIIFGIQLNNSEIELFKQIYQFYIIDPIEKLFAQTIDIPENSNKFSKFYLLMKTHLKFKEIFGSKNNIFGRIDSSFLDDINNLDKYLWEASNLKILEEIKKLDQQSYRNELELRKESEPNWLLLKDSTMQENLNNQQIEVSTDKNKDIVIEASWKHLEVTVEKYLKQISNILLIEFVNDIQQNYQTMKNNKEWSEIFNWQNFVLGILNGEGVRLWFDTRIDKYCFRSKIDGNIIYEKKDKISELLTRALKESITNYLNRNSGSFFSTHAIEIVLVDKLKGVNSQQLNVKEKASNVIKILLFENAIFSIDDDKFDVQSSSEFIRGENHLFNTRNRFIPTKYLKKRFDNGSINCNNFPTIQNLFIKNDTTYLYEKNKQNSEKNIHCQPNTFIEQFIFYLVDEDYHIFYYVMNWLAVFFNSLQKSGTALVLLGNQEVTQNILWDKMIKEIFGLQYCITLNDEECSTASSFDIAKDKLFFHIGDILNPATQFDDTTLYKLVKDFLIKPSVAKLNENNEQEETTIQGQMIITAKNPFPYIKRAMSKCTIIKVNDMDTIIEKLGIPDEVILENKIQKDLDNFTDILRSFKGDYSLAQYAMDTEDRETIKNNKSPNIDKEYIDNKIYAFIQAIKAKDIGYFEKVKDIEDGVIYEHLKNAFDKDEGYFIGQDLLHYYNSIHEQKYDKNKQLMDKLKEKDDMFNQEVKTLKILDKDQNEQVLFQSYKTSKETKNKELYKIVDYKMAKDIIIPYGATIVSTQDNLRKYGYADIEDIDNCIKRTEEYRAEKAREKEQK